MQGSVRSSEQDTKMAHGAEDSNIMTSCGLSRLARDTEDRIQPREEDKAGKSWMGIGHISAPDRWAAMQSRTLFPARTWEIQPGNQCRRQHINQGNNPGTGGGDSSPADHSACARVEGEAGKDGAWENGDYERLEPGSKRGRMQMLNGGGFRGRIKHTLQAGHQEGLQTRGCKRKADEPGKGSVLAQSSKHEDSRRPEKAIPDTGVCPLGCVLPCLSLFLLLEENKCRLEQPRLVLH